MWEFEGIHAFGKCSYEIKERRSEVEKERS
jgi:hypothetical protein